MQGDPSVADVVAGAALPSAICNAELLANNGQVCALHQHSSMCGI
jgi:hypothetical protein